MKKGIIILFILLFCTGCSIKYNLKIDRDMNFEENMSIEGTLIDYSIETSTEEDEKFIKEYNESMFQNDSDYSIKENEVNGNKYYFEIESKENNVMNLKDSNLIKKIYNTVDVNKKSDGTYTFKFSRDYKDIKDDAYTGLEFDDLIINIKSKKKIINSNADKVENTTYTWEINKNNIKDIYFEITESNAFDKNYLYVIILTPLFIALLYLILKSKKTNEIK